MVYPIYNKLLNSLLDKRYINVKFNQTEYLIHGRSYAICIHAPETVIQHEKWRESLDAVTSCSDGVTIDLTPPKPGNVWIGHDPQFLFRYKAFFFSL